MTLNGTMRDVRWSKRAFLPHRSAGCSGAAPPDSLDRTALGDEAGGDRSEIKTEQATPPPRPAAAHFPGAAKPTPAAAAAGPRPRSRPDPTPRDRRHRTMTPQNHDVLRRPPRQGCSRPGHLPAAGRGPPQAGKNRGGAAPPTPPNPRPCHSPHDEEPPALADAAAARRTGAPRPAHRGGHGRTDGRTGRQMEQQKEQRQKLPCGREGEGEKEVEQLPAPVALKI